jgi:hypothetical protein
MNDTPQHLHLLYEDDDYYYWQNFQACLDNMRRMDEEQDND